jgi:hypothetical protein
MFGGFMCARVRVRGCDPEGRVRTRLCAFLSHPNDQAHEKRSHRLDGQDKLNCNKIQPSECPRSWSIVCEQMIHRRALRGNETHAASGSELRPKLALSFVQALDVCLTLSQPLPHVRRTGYGSAEKIARQRSSGRLAQTPEILRGKRVRRGCFFRAQPFSHISPLHQRPCPVYPYGPVDDFHRAAMLRKASF